MLIAASACLAAALMPAASSTAFAATRDKGSRHTQRHALHRHMRRKASQRLVSQRRGSRPAPRRRIATASGLPAPACSVFVSPNGNSSVAGISPALPTRLPAAVSRLVPGSVVCLEAGTYNTRSNIYLSRSGTASAPIYYRNYGGAALIQYTGGSADGGVLQVTGGSSWHGAHDIVIEGLTIDGANLIGGGIFVTQGAHHVTIENCVIRNTGATGIALNATDYATVAHNLISHVGYNQGWSSGISLWYGGTGATYGGSTARFDNYPGFHNVIVDNIISGSYDNSGNHSDGNGIIVDGSGSIPPALIANNLVYENGGRGIEVYYNSGAVWVVNNTAYADGLDLQDAGGQAPDFMAMDATGAHFVNDLAYGRENGSSYTTGYIYNNTSSTIGWATSIGYDGSSPGVASGSFAYANPQFTGAPAIPTTGTPWASATPPWSIGSDLTVQASSPAVNAGTNPATAPGMTSALAAGIQQYMATDLAGNPRTQGGTTDIGAYER
jgi:Right handed beta helix region